MVSTTNAFSDASPELDPAGRKRRYVGAFDELRTITQQLRDRITATPVTEPDAAAAIRDELLAVTDVVLTQIDANQAEAGALALTSYETWAIDDGHLFTGTEKALSTLLKRLNELGRDYSLDGLEGTCGRA
jgi:hypothetical protein